MQFIMGIYWPGWSHDKLIMRMRGLSASFWVSFSRLIRLITSS
jgi:hypothetical protein